ncbi:ribonuclease HII [Bdellovibrionota bacterium]
MPDQPGLSSRKPFPDPVEDLSRQGYKLIAGIDEVGRGCLAGPVVAAAVILPFPCSVQGIRDSKQLTDKKRRKLTVEIKQIALGWALGEMSAECVDKFGIQQASILAMAEAVKGLNLVPDYLLIDGRIKLPFNIPQQGIIRGDNISQAIAAASIVAKVYRDDLMISHDSTFPQYQFAKHKGYGTTLHREAIRKFGPIPLHRKSFSRVKEYV